MTAKNNILYYGMILFGMILGVGCSTRKNTPVTRAYHELTTRYNIYHNAENAYHTILEHQSLRNNNNYSELLSFYPRTPLRGKTLPGGPFDGVVEKTSKAIREHSITAKPRRDPAKRQTEAYRRWLQQQEFNPFIQKVWLLLGKAHLQNSDYDQALAVFTHMQRIYNNESDLIMEVQLWMMRTYTEMERMYDAEHMLQLLRSSTIPESLHTLFNETYTHYLLRKRAYSEAIPWLIKVIDEETNAGQKRRLRYLLGQIYTLQGEKDKAFRAFETVKGLNTPFELTLHATISQLAVAPEAAQPAIRRTLTKMRSKTENESDLSCIQLALEHNHPDTTANLSLPSLDNKATLTASFALDATRDIAQQHDSLYQEAYRAWQQGDTTTVRSFWESFHSQYPRSGLLPQFLLLNALSYAQTGNETATERYLGQLVERFPESDAVPLARSIIDGLAQGRALNVNATLSSDWGTYPTANADALGKHDENVSFSNERSGLHLLLLTFKPGSPDKNRILFSMANFNFSQFSLRTFDFSFITIPGGEALLVQPFHSYDEVWRYVLMMQSDSLYTHQIRDEVTPLIISKENLSILLEQGTMEGYRLFSFKNFGEDVTIQAAQRTVVRDRSEKITQKSEKIVPLEVKEMPEVVGNAAAPLTVEDEKDHTSVERYIVPLTVEKRISPEELQRKLEQKAEEALQQKKEQPSGGSRQASMKERERERQEKIKQRERVLKERARGREAALKKRERERNQKIRNKK